MLTKFNQVMTTVLFWDIDGTLIDSCGAGRLALAEAASQMIGGSVDLSSVKMAGLTERSIALNILETIGVSAMEQNLQTFLSLYKKNIAAYLHQTEGYIIAGVPEILETLKNCEQVISILLTGNCAVGAWAKLSHYGLNHYFQLGAFGEKYCDRTDLAKFALTLAQQQVNNLNLDKCYVIGDTPHDIRCGQAIGAKTIAIANEHYGVDELASHHSSLVWEKFPSPASFMAQVGLGG